MQMLWVACLIASVSSEFIYDLTEWTTVAHFGSADYRMLTAYNGNWTNSDCIYIATRNIGAYCFHVSNNSLGSNLYNQQILNSAYQSGVLFTKAGYDVAYYMHGNNVQIWKYNSSSKSVTKLTNSLYFTRRILNTNACMVRHPIDEKYLFIVGQRYDNGDINALYIYDILSGNLTFGNNLTGFHGIPMCAVAKIGSTNYLYVVGGRSVDIEKIDLDSVVSDMDSTGGLTTEWIQTSTSLAGLHCSTVDSFCIQGNNYSYENVWGAAIVNYNEYIIIIGGAVATDISINLISYINVDTEEVGYVGTLPFNISNAPAVVADDRIYLFGGSYIYNPESLSDDIVQSSIFPTLSPTDAPTSTTLGPTAGPTFDPTSYPTLNPTLGPTAIPTVLPTVSTLSPSVEPTATPNTTRSAPQAQTQTQTDTETILTTLDTDERVQQDTNNNDNNNVIVIAIVVVIILCIVIGLLIWFIRIQIKKNQKIPRKKDSNVEGKENKIGKNSDNSNDGETKAFSIDLTNTLAIQQLISATNTPLSSNTPRATDDNINDKGGEKDINCNNNGEDITMGLVNEIVSENMNNEGEERRSVLIENGQFSTMVDPAVAMVNDIVNGQEDIDINGAFAAPPMKHVGIDHDEDNGIKSQALAQQRVDRDENFKDELRNQAFIEEDVVMNDILDHIETEK